MRWIVQIVGTAICCILTLASAYSAPVDASTTYRFTGNITGFDRFGDGSTVTLQYSFDPFAPNSGSNIHVGGYVQGTRLEYFEWGGNVYDLEGASSQIIYVTNARFDSEADMYEFSANLSGEQFGWQDISVNLRLRDSSRSAFDDVSLPDNIALSDFDSRRITLRGSEPNPPGTAYYNAGADVASFQVVPIPAAAWLFGSALLGLGLVRHRAK